MNNIAVYKIDAKDTKDFLLNKHYARRIPSISYAFGLFIDNQLQGVLTIDKPASNSLCNGVCGEIYSKKVFELNRLIVNDGLERNSRKKFLKELKYPIVKPYPKVPYSTYELGTGIKRKVLNKITGEVWFE